MHAGVDAGQAFPQAPQLRESEFRLAHAPLQHAVDIEQQV
jgi:hypothetical protein